LSPFDGLRIQFAGGLSIAQWPTLFTTRDEAHEEAMHRLLVSRLATQIRLDRGFPRGEVVRVTLHDKDGTVLFEGEGGEVAAVPREAGPQQPDRLSRPGSGP